MIKGISEKYSFSKAVPVWEKGAETEKNHSLLFRYVVEGNEKALLRIAAHCRYQIFINGNFYAAGPARAGHGFYRVSEYTLEKELSADKNIITFIVAGYNVNSFYLLDEPSFFCAEAVREDKILFATGDGKCEAERYSPRLVKTPRYSFQRPFTECYRLDGNYDSVRTDYEKALDTVEIAPTKDKNFICRNTPYCIYTEKKAEKLLAEGKMKKVLIGRKRFKDRSLVGINETLKGFAEKELETSPVNELYAYRTHVTEKKNSDVIKTDIASGNCAIYDMGRNNTGYIKLSLKADNNAVVYAVFNEILPDGVCPDPGKDACENVIKWELTGGREYELISFEPYTFRYIQLVAFNSEISVGNVSLLEECYPETDVINVRKMPTENLQKVYDAAVETFRQNSTDIFMDCPSRERAGWLCDSYFTARVEKELTGKSLVEHDFLENFLLPEKFRDIPGGMLPMCYPAEHYDGSYIHNWAFWYVLELKEYFDRTGDRELIDAAKKRVYELLEFTKSFENSDGLLEKVEGWVFVEWSKANDFVQDINYPSNMLYSKVLDTVAELYGDDALCEKADALRKTVVEKSFDGEFFCDNAVYDKNGVAVRTGNRTETCQYYAFFTGTATRENFSELHKKMFTEFGPDRKNNNSYPDIPFSNAFIGNYLRLFILFEEGEYEKLTKEIESFFLPMAEKTGTLWENMTDYASCCHGFASHVAYWLNKTVN